MIGASALFLVQLILLSACAGSVVGSCKGGDDVCVDGDNRVNESPAIIFDVFANWVHDRSIEGQQFLKQLFPPSSENNREDGNDFTSFFDEIKDAFASTGTQAGGEESLEDKLKAGFSKVKDESIAQFSSEQKSKPEPDFGFFAFFQSVLSAGETDGDGEMAAEFIQKASELTMYLQSNKAKRGFLELQDIVLKALGDVTDSVVRNFGGIEWQKLKPFSIIYFLEYMESLLTPSQKRRDHVFAKEVSEKEVRELHKALYLASLAYLDTIDEIKEGLQEDSSEWQLIYAQLSNGPGEPAHYIAMRKENSLARHDYLELLLVVRGTKDFSDVLSDGLLDAVDFRGGYGHAGLVKSGQYLVDHHLDLFESLLEMAKKERIKLTMLGHSLGAGAAAVAAIIFNEDVKYIEANAIGFGCPSLVSRELSESASKYITTVVSDSDMIPRLSGPTLINAALGIMSYDWIEKGLADLRYGLDFLQEKMPFDIPTEHIDNVYDFIERLLHDNVKIEFEEMAKVPREEVLLMPPGSCTHFYRDGNGVSGQRISCDFFNSLEISRTMIDDHLINIGYNRMLLEYMRHRREHYQFVFDQKIV